MFSACGIRWEVSVVRVCGPYRIPGEGAASRRAWQRAFAHKSPGRRASAPISSYLGRNVSPPCLEVARSVRAKDVSQVADQVNPSQKNATADAEDAGYAA